MAPSSSHKFRHKSPSQASSRKRRRSNLINDVDEVVAFLKNFVKSTDFKVSNTKIRREILLNTVLGFTATISPKISVLNPLPRLKMKLIMDFELPDDF